MGEGEGWGQHWVEPLSISYESGFDLGFVHHSIVDVPRRISYARVF